MSESTPPPAAGRAIARRDFEAIIRRAAELSLAESDPGDFLSEDEVLRIAGELGLPAHHVRKALYEQPVLAERETWYSRWFGPAGQAQSRAVAGRAEPLQARLEEYLARQEYLQVIRRRPHELVLGPAEDTISKVARAFARPKGRFGLAHSQRVVLAIDPMPEDRVHVRIETDFAEERKRGATGGVLAGGSLGLLTGAGLAVIAAVTTSGPLEAVLIGANLVASVGAGVTIAVRAEAKKFRDRMARVAAEIDHLLDRVETGQTLEPPPAPWRRNLQAKLFGNPRR